MNNILRNWIQVHTNTRISSPRSRAKDFEITSIDDEKGIVTICFEGKNHNALPLTFEMFDRAYWIIEQENGKWVQIGASVNNPQPGTIEGEIWKKPYLNNYTSTYKAAPHVCDFLVLAGLAQYGKTKNPITGRIVQAIKLQTKKLKNSSVIHELPTKDQFKENKELIFPLEKEIFLRKYQRTIINWTRNNKLNLIEARKNYSWNNNEHESAIKNRDKISQAIVLSRIKNSGGIDLQTLDLIMNWGGFNRFPLRTQNRLITITREVFDYVDQDSLQKATEILLEIKGVGISRASKIIGLFDPQRFCIYDSRVGQALKSLKDNNEPILKCPSGRGRPGDICTDKDWADNYQKLIWTTEVIKNYLDSQGYPFNIADVEMALFMMGK